MVDDFNPMHIADQFHDFVTAMTGLKNTFINEGWSEEVAEQLVLAALRGGQSN